MTDQIFSPRMLRRIDAEQPKLQSIAPCSPFDTNRFDKGRALLENAGFCFQPPFPNPSQKHGYLNDDDDTRLAELVGAYSNSENQIVWCARGGYGLTRLLPLLDQAFPTQKSNPLLVGFSDVTALFCWLWHRHKLPSLHAPMVTTLPLESAESLKNLWELAKGAVDGLEFQDLEVLFSPSTSQTLNGPLICGNLVVLTHLVGTDAMPDLRGSLLAIEEVGERPYRIDRLLMQLRAAGSLDGVLGIICGQFTACEETGEGQTRFGPVPSALEVVRTYGEALQIPVVKGLPIGHRAPNQGLPFGGMATLHIGDSSAHLEVEVPWAKTKVDG